MIIKAYAKINLTLDVVGRLGGMHLLDSIVAQIDLADDIDIVFREDHAVNCELPGLAPGDVNSVVKAIRLLMEEYDVHGADIGITKRIPMLAGLGGSTADGIAVYKAYALKYGLAIRPDLLIKLGSDAPAMYEGGICRMRGVGDIITPVDLDFDPYLVILTANGGVSSAEGYRVFDELGLKTADSTYALMSSTDPYKALGNDLEPAAVKINPDILRVKNVLNKLGADSVVMTGSGSGVVAYFKEQPKMIPDGAICARIMR